MTSLFNKLCPLYMALGMSYDEFWNQEPERAQFYLKAYRLKSRIQREKDDVNIWKQGVYDYEALIRVSPILHAFSKKGTKPLPFPEQPIFKYNDYEQETIQDIEKKEREAEYQRLSAQIYFNNWYKSAKRHFDKKEK